MSVLEKYLNPIYLNPNYIEDVRESIKAKPDVSYFTLDNFFREEIIEQFIEEHKKYEFSERLDKFSHDGDLLPYDSSVVFAEPGVHFGSDLFFSEEWKKYCSYISTTEIPGNIGTEIKLRYHKPFAEGFWIHTDSENRDLVAICYFNKNWKASDGGLLQLWRVDEIQSENTPLVENPFGRLDCLNTKRLKTSSPGGGFSEPGYKDLILIDQIVPVYNRIFICNFRKNPAFHSVSPSMNKERTGFVQWMFQQQ